MASAHTLLDDKAFAIITKDSVRLMAESAGYSGISDNVAVILGEDVSYRLRETVMKSAAFMKNAKRRRLCTEDFNHALRNSDVQPIFGHGSSSDSAPFRLTREGELHFVEDADITLNNSVCNTYVPKSLGKASVKGQWMAVEGMSRMSTFSSAHSQLTHKNPKQEVPDELMSYYHQITQALFGSHTLLVKWALADLSTNPSVTRLLPYFVNFVANGVKAVSHDISKLTVLMRTVESLMRNQALFMEPHPYLNLLVQSLESCLLEPLAAYINQQSNDHWMLRQLAAQLLVEIIRKWGNEMNHLHQTVTRHLGDILKDLSRPLCSHYGAVIGLKAMGPGEIKTILVPKLDTLLPWLQHTMNDLNPTSQHLHVDALRVYDSILVAVEEMLKIDIDEYLRVTRNDSSAVVDAAEGVEEGDAHWRGSDGCAERGDVDRGRCHGGVGTSLYDDLLTLYQRLCGYFGDALCIRLPVLTADCVSGQPPLEDPVSLDNIDSRRSGEQLLADLLQQVHHHSSHDNLQPVNHHHSHDDVQPVHHYRSHDDLQSVHHHRSHDDLQTVHHDQHQMGFLSERSGHSSMPLGQLADQVAPSAGCSQWVSSDPTEVDSDSPQQQLAVSSSTISDPSKGTLKLKIKRHTHGQNSPPLSQQTMQSTMTWAESDTDLYRDRRRKQMSKNYWEHEVSDSAEVFDSEDTYSNQMCGQPCSGGESSGSESSLHRKGKLRLKLKVPSKESTSD